jgi:hypothetical protein
MDEQDQRALPTGHVVEADAIHLCIIMLECHRSIVASPSTGASERVLITNFDPLDRLFRLGAGRSRDDNCWIMGLKLHNRERDL